MMLHELNPQEREQYQDVAEELRCLVCQNQSVYDSQAGLASDIKQIVVDQIREGRSKVEIKTYMEDRYGEFILYQPEVSSANAVLWAGPFVVLVLAIFLARRVIHARKPAAQGVPKASSVRQGHESKPPKAGAKAQSQAKEDWAESLYQQERER